MKLFILKTSFFFLLITIVARCGYFENDQIEFQKIIVGNIQIHKQKNDDTYNLVYSESDETFSVLVEDCLTVNYDSIGNQIFAESFINKSNSVFFEIKIIDSNSQKALNAIVKKSITKELFLINIDSKFVKLSFPKN
jgi:hypothetical protein